MSDEVEYRDVPGFPGYRAGSDGSVWSRRRRGNNLGIFAPDWHQLKVRVGTRGYRMVAMSRGSRATVKMRKVSRVILESFVGPQPDGMECCHNDGCPVNDAISNLRWGTKIENAEDRKRHGTGAQGEGNPAAKLTEDLVRTMRAMHAAGTSCPKIAKWLQNEKGITIDRTTAWLVVTRRNWPEVA